MFRNLSTWALPQASRLPGGWCHYVAASRRSKSSLARMAGSFISLCPRETWWKNNCKSLTLDSVSILQLSQRFDRCFYVAQFPSCERDSTSLAYINRFLQRNFTLAIFFSPSDCFNPKRACEAEKNWKISCRKIISRGYFDNITKVSRERAAEDGNHIGSLNSETFNCFGVARWKNPEVCNLNSINESLFWFPHFPFPFQPSNSRLLGIEAHFKRGQSWKYFPG